MTLKSSCFSLAALAASALVAAQEVDIATELQRMTDALNSGDFVEYTRPNQKVTEFITLGDSYTAGTGSNGDKEKVGGAAVRGKRAYPFHMRDDTDSWEFINGDSTVPRLTFSAFTGDTSVELITQQLKPGGYKDNNWDQARDIPFGHPQLGVLTIGGNDAKLSTILNDCIYRAWRPGNCDDTLNSLEAEIQNGHLKEKISLAMYKAAEAGRHGGGAEPREAFQLYVPGYIAFFNHDNPECDSVDWKWWTHLGDPVPLTVDLRKRLNQLVEEVNTLIKDAASDLGRMGVIFVDGLQREYDGHRYCEPGHTSQEMTDAEVWFWSRYSKTDSDQEDVGGSSVEQELLDFVFPGAGHVAASIAEGSPPPWEWEGADKYPDFESLLRAMAQAEGDVNIQAETPFNLLRSFHPKGTAYQKHAELLLAAIADNRASVSSNPDAKMEFLTRCKDWFIDNHLMVATCTDSTGVEKKTQSDLNLCVKWVGPDQLVPSTEQEANFKDRCNENCFFNTLSPEITNQLWCVCSEENNDKGFMNQASIKIETLIGVLDNGHMICEGHISAPSDRNPPPKATRLGRRIERGGRLLV
ncbi:SGNH hydrolase-type esterase domain containing protein [Rhypophila decipiens]